MPKWFEKALKRDLAAFVWQRQPQIDMEEEGTSSKFRRWLSSSIASLPANLGGIAELDLTLFSQAMLVGWVKRFIHPRMAPWKLVVEHWLSPLLSLYTNGDLRWLMVGTVPIKHIISATPCPLWKHIFGLWGKVRAKLQPSKLRHYEVLVSQPVWFNKRLPLKGLKFSATHTVKAKWAPLAPLDVSTLRDIMGANHKWFTPAP